MSNKLAELKQIVVLRTALPTDTSFIFSSWLKSFRSSPFARNVTNTIYFKEHHQIIEDLIASSQVVVACEKRDQNSIVGYAVAGVVDNLFTLHYTYVKQTFRRLGVGEYMVKALNPNIGKVDCCYTHDNTAAQRLAAKYKLIYYPYLMVAPILKPEEV